jgi:hypothetical protein
MLPLLPVLFAQNGDQGAQLIVLRNLKQIALKPGTVDTFFHQPLAGGRIEVLLALLNVGTFERASPRIEPAALKLHEPLRQWDSNGAAEYGSMEASIAADSDISRLFHENRTNHFHFTDSKDGGTGRSPHRSCNRLEMPSAYRLFSFLN